MPSANMISSASWKKMELGLSFTRMPVADDAAAENEMALRVWLRLMDAALGQLDSMLEAKVAGAPLLRHREGLFQHQGQPEAGLVLLWPTYWPDVLASILSWSLEQWAALSAVTDEIRAAQIITGAKASWKKLGTAVKPLLPHAI
jgi:hypothetical protein